MDPVGSVETAMRARIDLLVAGEDVIVTPRLCSTIGAAHTLLDSMLAAVGDSDPDAPTLRQHVQEVERLKRRVEAVELRLLAKAAKKHVPEGSGHPDAGAWFSDVTKGDRRRSASDADLADALGDEPSGEESAGVEPAGDGPKPPQTTGLGATGAALDRGGISAEHAKVILRALDDLPEGVTDEQRRTCEAELLRLAVNRSPAQLRIAGRRVIDRIEADLALVDAHEEGLVASEEERADAASAFWIKDNQDGTMTGHFTVSWASGTILKKVVDAMTAPRRRSAHERPGGWQDLDRRARHLDWQHRRGQALADLLLRLPTDHLHDKVAATLLVTTRLTDLQDRLARPQGRPSPRGGVRVASTDSTQVLSAGTVRRMACGAGIIPTVLGTDSVPVDLGRATRLFTGHQRLALATRYTECAADGCDRPFAWTEIHHLTPWQHGGPTDLDNAVPLCGRHHRMIDGPAWDHGATRLPDRTVRIAFTRRT